MLFYPRYTMKGFKFTANATVLVYRMVSLKRATVLVSWTLFTSQQADDKGKIRVIGS